jgi:hypothetical protein
VVILLEAEPEMLHLGRHFSFHHLVDGLLAQHKCSAEWLTAKLTEGSSMVDPKRTMQSAPPG